MSAPAPQPTPQPQNKPHCTGKCGCKWKEKQKCTCGRKCTCKIVVVKPPPPPPPAEPTAASKAKDRVLDALATFVEGAFVKKAPPPPPPVKVGDLALKVKDTQRLDAGVDDLINRAVDGALEGIARGVSKPFRKRGPAYLVWGMGIAYWLTEVAHLARGGLHPNDLLQLSGAVFVITLVASKLIRLVI